jgi:CDP-glycerol glycerophosphotransferase
MARISVVVPIYNVEQFLEECLDSIAAQTFGDLEVIMVDDGSTDSSGEIAAGYSERDPRFKLVTRPNGGLSAARNTGLEHAQAEFLAFVDSDDRLALDAYERLLGALEQTGSDFATGNVHRLTARGTSQTRFLTTAFAKTRLKTHVTHYPPLIADRTVWNKLWRRAFWDSLGQRFPERVLNEDIPIVVPAHFKARSVDVLADPVYHWRIREEGTLSITERRAEVKALVDRLDAVEQVADWLREHGPPEAVRWYDESLVDDDLRYYLNVLDRTGEEYRQLFLDRVNALLDRADDDIYEPLHAIYRLKWRLVRMRRLEELDEVLRFHREDLPDTPPVKIRGRYYGDYPFLGDERLNIPLDVYELRREIAPLVRIERLALEDGLLRVEGLAYFRGVGAPEKGFQRVSVAALAPGRLRRVRLAVTRGRFRTRQVHRPDANQLTGERLADVSWAGFSATLDPARLRGGDRWDLYVTIAAGRLRRRLTRFAFGDVTPPDVVELGGSEALARARPTGNGQITVRAQAEWAMVDSARMQSEALALEGRLRGQWPRELRLELVDDGGRSLRAEAEVTDGRWRARVPVGALVEEPSWEIHLAGGGRRVRVALSAETGEPTWRCGERELALVPWLGDAALVLRAPRVALERAGWAAEGQLELAGAAPGGAPVEVVLVERDLAAEHAFAARVEDGRFRARLPVSRVPSLRGELPLPEGRWEVLARAGETTFALAVAPAVRAGMPLHCEVAHKDFRLLRTDDLRAVLDVSRDIAPRERGAFHQRRLAGSAYRPRRVEPLRDSIVYTSFGGRECSDGPRALHAELARRGAPLEHLWVVRDAAAAVPDGAIRLREGSGEHFEALARARYVVTNDHFPAWFERREGQVGVQTWHGTPVRRVGFDVPRRKGRPHAFERGWEVQRRSWQYVVSPNRFTSGVLRDAWRLQESEIIELGYPRDDVLAGPGIEGRVRAVRDWLGVPEGVRAVLYAPTYREQVRDLRGRHRLDVRLDLERMHAALGDDHVLLFRTHHDVVDPAPARPEGFVRDVSAYPDAVELLLAADVLVTDYSPLAVDYAITRRPMLFHTYDLDVQAQVRGFYFDLEETLPGPLVSGTAEVVEALREVDSVSAGYAERYAAFRERFCEPDDGGAAARVVDRVFA